MTSEHDGWVQHPDMESMDASDWNEYLREHPNQRLVVNDLKGTHTFQYDSLEERVTFYAYGSMGYDRDGTQAALEEIAGTSDGMKVHHCDML